MRTYRTKCFYLLSLSEKIRKSLHDPTGKALPFVEACRGVLALGRAKDVNPFPLRGSVLHAGRCKERDTCYAFPCMEHGRKGKHQGESHGMCSTP